MLTFSLLETLGENDLFADDVKPITQQWLTKVNELGRDVKNQKLRQVEWQKQTEELFKKVDLPELLKFIKFDELTKNAKFVDKGARSLRPKFPSVEGLPKEFVFGRQIFALKKGRSVIPHGHNNMATAFLVLKGDLNGKHYDRLEDQKDHLLIKPTIDRKFVLLFPDASKPIVTVNLTIFVGSRHEGYGEAGMAHLLEHMLFKGTPTHKDIPKMLQDRGAEFNGTTWLDRTNYYETMPSQGDNMEFAIKLEADRMMNSLIRAEDLKSEMTVVRSEFERGENSPTRILEQRMWSGAYEWHNYGRSTIGNKADIERVPVENLRVFYRKYYQPDNAMVVVAGKFDPEKALSLIVKHFGSIPAPKRELPKTYTEEPPQDGERVVTLRRVGDIAVAGLMYHIPAGAHPDYVSIDVLENILTSSPSGRLYQSLVKTRKAANVSGAAYALHDPGVLKLQARVTKGNDPQIVLESMLDTIEKVVQKGVTEDEVKRAKVSLLKSWELGSSNIQEIAIELSEWAAQGDWRLYFLYRDRVEKVSAESVNRVAAKYLKRNNRTVGLFLPTKAPERVSVPATPDLAKMIGAYRGRKVASSGEAFDVSPANIQARTKHGTLPGGIKVAMLRKKNRGELVVLKLTLRYGDLKNLRGLVAATEFLPSLMTRGTKEMSRQEIKDQLDKNKVRMSADGNPGRLTFTIQTTRTNVPAALNILKQILREPTLPESELEILKQSKLSSLQGMVSSPQGQAMTFVRGKLDQYPKDDPRYAPTLPEQIKRTKAVTPTQIRKLYTEYLGAENSTVTIVGDFDPEKTLPLISESLSGWEASKSYSRISKTVTKTPPGVQKNIVIRGKPNLMYFAAMSLPIRDDHPDYPALMLGNYILGGGSLASRLGVKVRQKAGLSYTVGSGFQASPIDERAAFYIYAISNRDNMPKAKGRRERMLVLYPVASLMQARRQAAIPPLAVGGVTLLAMVVISVWMAGRLGRRIRTIQEQVAKIADGDFQEFSLAGRNDEISDLIDSINRMSRRLLEMQETLRRTERAGLLGQFAGGLAHQLRNAITGARLAIQIHQRRCENGATDGSLDVALRQLSLTEEQVKGLLSLGKPERRTPVSAALDDLVTDVGSLVSPVCEHAGVQFEIEVNNPQNSEIVDSESVRIAVLNLVLNGVDAAGTGGRVTMNAETRGRSVTWTVTDTGPGPPPELIGRLTEMFVICWGFQEFLTEDGHEVSVAASAEEAFAAVRNKRPDAVVLDVRLPGIDGLTAIRKLREEIGETPIIVITAFGNLETAVKAVEEGAFDYLPKPFDLAQAAEIVGRALKAARPVNSDEPIPVETSADHETLIGSSPAMQEIFKQIALVSQSKVPVLITGESGTGKEVVARAIHANSSRRDEPFVPVCLPALSPGVVESELFGHSKGAFTGADHARSGLLELAAHGTVFLDEIADADPGLQVKLLRALEQREITPVGDVHPRPFAARILAATNRVLPTQIAAGEFREDLYFRLSVFQIHLPPLRDRQDDIPILARHFLRLLGRDASELSADSETVAELKARAWAGNVRELRNTIERAVIVARGQPIRPEHLPAPMQSLNDEAVSPNVDLERMLVRWTELQCRSVDDSDEKGELYETLLATIEPPVLRAVLQHCNNNRATAASVLGIHRTTLRQKLRKYEID
eukprot:g26575.t1